MRDSKRILALTLLIGLYAAVPILLFIAGVGILLGVLYIGRFLGKFEILDSLKGATSMAISAISGYAAWRTARWLNR